MKLLCIVLLLGLLYQRTDAIATMAIDIGSEFMKVAIVKPGVPMETALNRDSQRKTPVVVSLRNNERTIGDPALSTAVKFPANAFIYIPTIIGKTLDSPVVQEFQRRFPYYKLSANEQGTITFEMPDKQKFTTEEILAMLLENAQETAEKFADHAIKDAVVTVPPFYTQADRKAVLRAAEYAGITVLQLMNNNAAVALNFGIFRSKSFNKTAQYYMFFDMGSSSTTVSVVSYQVGRVREHGMVEEHPQVQILGVGYDETLGATAFILRLRDHLAKQFNKMKLSNKDVTQNARAMAKLFKEAARVYRILSANKEAFAQIENVFDDKDFKFKVTRDDLESLCEDLYSRVQRPIEGALNIAQLPLNVIKEVILMGGGTRNPKVQDMVMKATGKSELGKSINTDEAAALGAVYQAAHLSPGFRVKRFVVKDATLFPLAVDFKTAEDKKEVKRVLFNIGNPYPQRKVMTFNKHSEDFHFTLGYTGLNHLNEFQQKSLGSSKLLKFNLKGVKEAMKKYQDRDGVQSKGVKAHFRKDDSGIIQLDKVEALFEVAPSAAGAAAAAGSTAPDADKPSSTFSKLGESIGNLFGSSSGDKADGENSKQQDNTNAGTDDKEKPNEEKPKAAEANATDANATASVVNATAKAEMLRESIEFLTDNQNLPEPDEAARKKSRAVIVELRRQDEEKRLLEKARNELESFIFDAKDKLTHDEYEKCSTEAERTGFMEKLTAAQDWYDEQGVDTKTEDFNGKAQELKNMLSDLKTRVKEMSERPKAFKMLNDMLNHTQSFWSTMKNMTGDGNVFTQAEYTALGNLINDTKDWQQARKLEADKQDLTKEPLVRVEDIRLKMSSLEREISYLLGKIKYYVPPKKPEAKSDSETDKSAKEEEKASKKEGDDKQKQSDEEKKQDKQSSEQADKQEHEEKKSKEADSDKEQQQEQQQQQKQQQQEKQDGRKADDEL